MTLVPVESVRAGDEIVLPRLGARPVVRVDVGEGDEYRVIYRDAVVNAWENRARDKGRWNTIGGGWEKALAPRHAGDLIEIAA